MNSKNSRYLFYIIIAPWAIFFALRNTGFLVYDGAVFSVYLAVFCFILLSLTGAAYGATTLKFDRQKLESIAIEISEPRLLLLIKIIGLLSLIYVLMSGYDNIVVRGVLRQGVTVARDAAQGDAIRYGARNSLFGGVAFILSGLPILLACLVWGTPRQFIGWRPQLFYSTIVLFSLVTYFLGGGRNPFFIAVSTISFYLWFDRLYLRRRSITSRDRRKKTNSVSKIVFLLVSLIVIAGLAYSIIIFQERSELRGYSLDGLLVSLQGKSYFYINSPDLDGALSKDIFASFLLVIFYFTHSLEYFSEYLSTDYSPMFLGAYNFSFFARVFDILTGTSYLENMYNGLMARGVYLSLPNALYLDFGFFGLLISSVIIGFTAGRFFTFALINGRYDYLFFASVFSTIYAFSPVYSVPVSSNGTPLILSALLFYFVNRGRKL